MFKNSNRLHLFVDSVFATLFCSIVFVSNSFADITGRSGTSGAPPASTCSRSGCHVAVAGAALPTLTLTGPTSVSVGSTNTYTAVLTGGPGATPAAGVVGVGGIDVATSAGTLIATMAGTALSTAATKGGVPGEIVQSVGTPFAAGIVTYTFNLQAPATNGTVTLYARGLSGNGDGADTGDGTTAPVTLAITVTGGVNSLPTAVITAPATGIAGTPVNFSGSGSTDTDGTIAAYDWNFGDNTAGTGVTTTHSYVAGTYTVTLKVTDNAGATGTITKSIVISAAGTPPPLAANAGGPYTGTAGTAIQFSGAASTGTNLTYAWNFGDATTPLGTGVSPTHTYAAAGTYTVTLTVTDGTGATNMSTATATVAAAGGGTTPPPASSGEKLYVDNCESCHGVNGLNGPDGSVVGASAEDIADAIEEEPEMAALPTLTALTEDEIEAIADFLDQGDEEDFGSAGSSKTKGKAHAAVEPAVAGAFDGFALLGAGLFWAVRRRKQ